MKALEVTQLCKSFGGLHVTRSVNLSVEPGQRRLIDLFGASDDRCRANESADRNSLSIQLRPQPGA